MSDQPKPVPGVDIPYEEQMKALETIRKLGDRTSVTISKRVHREFKVVCARLGITQRDTIEMLVKDWVEQEEEYRLSLQEKEE